MYMMFGQWDLADRYEVFETSAALEYIFFYAAGFDAVPGGFCSLCIELL